MKRVYIIAGEDSGDALGAALMDSLRRITSVPLDIEGFGGAQMVARGIHPPFPLEEVAVMGAIAILKDLPRLVRRAREVISACLAFSPDVIVIIDSPEFTHRIASRLRKALPGVPIINYVSPSVWAWRAYRARLMNAYVDEVLALLPFEPQVYHELGGPDCTFVGHPISETFDRLQGGAKDPDLVLLLPGSRTSEVTRLMPIFAGVLEVLASNHPQLRFVLPAADAQIERVQKAIADWVVKPEIVGGTDAREAIMRDASLAIAASGTVTLELAIARVPMVVCYRIDWLIARFRFLLRAHSVVLPNLIAGGNDFPELIHLECNAPNIIDHAQALLTGGPDLEKQKAAFDRVEAAMQIEGLPPSERAARRVLHHLSLML